MPTIEDVISGLCQAQTEKLKNVDDEVKLTHPPTYPPTHPPTYLTYPMYTTADR